MTPPAGWQNPITVQPGQMQYGVDPLRLLSGRRDLRQYRLDVQRGLLRAGTLRTTPIEVTREGVIWDGHHAVRVAAEEGTTVDVLVNEKQRQPKAASIPALPVR
jgi:hypothetical protein